ncbi:hypothetical protein CKO16_20795 [Rhodoblastus acidophilus]|nr:hypothetical protein [Rhodoblastus acidophilus]PPQ35240.1 hypothetical protein CKO16_20795 [Rhodoblastus acidophilus]
MVDPTSDPNSAEAKDAANDAAPWTKSRRQTPVADGITFHETEHGSGFHVAADKNEKIDSAWREPNGWYEGQNKWSVVAINFPRAFESDDAVTAHTVAQKAFPGAYRDFTARMFDQPDEALGYAKMKNYYGAGIDHFETPLDHRIVVAPELNEKIDPAWRHPDGHYVSDGAKAGARASVVALSFPERFDPIELAAAHQDAKDFFPDIYEKVIAFERDAEQTRPASQDETALRSTTVAPAAEPPRVDVGPPATKTEPSVRDLMSAFDDEAPAAKAEAATSPTTETNRSERNQAAQTIVSASSTEGTNPSTSSEPPLPKAQPALKDLMSAFDETPPTIVNPDATKAVSATHEKSARNDFTNSSDGEAPGNLPEPNDSRRQLPNNPFTDDRTSAASPQKPLERSDNINQSHEREAPQQPEPNHPNPNREHSSSPNNQEFMRRVTAGEAIVSAFASAFQRRPRTEPSAAGEANPSTDQSVATPMTSRSPSSPQTDGASASAKGDTPQPNPVPPLSAVSQPAQAPAAEGVSGKPMRGSLGLRNLLTDFRPERSESISVAQTAPQDPASAPQAGSARALFDRFNQSRMQPRRDGELMQTAEGAATAAVGAFADLEKADSAAILSRIREAAATSSGGIKEVLSEMRPGGAYEDLRRDFNAALARDEKFSASYEKAANALDAYAEHRNAAAPVLPKANASVLAKLEALDEQIVKASSELPGRDSGKSALDETLDKGREAVKNLVDSLRNAFSREGPSASPGLSP